MKSNLVSNLKVGEPIIGELPSRLREPIDSSYVVAPKEPECNVNNELYLCKQHVISLEARIKELESQLINLDKNLSDLSLELRQANDHIAELEVPKSCKSCRYSLKTKDDPNFQGLSCIITEMLDMEDNFYCSYYEQKEQK